MPTDARDWSGTNHVTHYPANPSAATTGRGGANINMAEGGLAGAELRTFHIQIRSTASEHNIYESYDPMVGLKTAGFLGSFLMAIIGYIIYKAGCRRYGSVCIYYRFHYLFRSIIGNHTTTKVVTVVLQFFVTGLTSLLS